MDDATLVRRSQELKDAGDWGPDALDVNRELVDRHPEAAAARYRLALCFEAAGELLAARESYRRFLRLQPGGLEARVARRRVAILEERARAVATPSPHEALARARKHARAGALDRARVWYERANETASSASVRAQALTGLASLERTERRFRDALRLAERAIAAQPSRSDNKAAYAVLIAVLADLGRLETAREEAENLLAEHRRNRIVNSTAGRVFSELYKRTGDHAYRRKANRCFAEARRGR